MRAVWLLLVAGFRRQWRSWVLLGLLVAVASGFVLASTAAGRRTDSAFPRYVASHGYDAIVYTIKDLPELRQDPEVAQVTPVRMPFYDQPGCSCHRQIYTGAFSVREVPPASLGRVAKLVAGRMPDPSSPVEALASFTLERDYGVHLGTVITLPMAGASQRQAVFNAMNGQGPPPKKANGPKMAMRVVGIVAAERVSSGQGTTTTCIRARPSRWPPRARPPSPRTTCGCATGRRLPGSRPGPAAWKGPGSGPRPARGHDHDPIHRRHSAGGAGGAGCAGGIAVGGGRPGGPARRAPSTQCWPR